MESPENETAVSRPFHRRLQNAGGAPAFRTFPPSPAAAGSFIYKGAALVSPDNRSRGEINARIRAELQAGGAVGKDEHPTRVLVARQDLTGADRAWAARYAAGDVLLYSRRSKETGIGKGEYARVAAVDARANRLTVELADGSRVSYDPRRRQGVSVYWEERRAFAQGDRVQLTAPSKELGLANRELGTVERMGADGRLRVRFDGGRREKIDPARHPHLDPPRMEYEASDVAKGLLDSLESIAAWMRSHEQHLTSI